MAGSIPNEGEEDILDVIFATSLVLRLFSNNLTPVNASVLADFTEANFTGYAAVTLTGGSWTTTQADPSTAVYAQQSFTSTTTTPQTIYGYYITRTSSGRVWFAERFTSAKSISSTTPSIRITPTINLTDSGD